MIYIISDLHLNHSNIIKYCNRPFTTIDEMNHALIHNWNNVVKSEDVVYFLGDFCLGPKETFRRLSTLLNGNKHFILGNHDHISNPQILECGWNSCQREIKLNYNNNIIIMRHHPTKDIADNEILIYGHVHDKQADFLPHKSFCACVERINYTPISIDEILQNLTVK